MKQFLQAYIFHFFRMLFQLSPGIRISWIYLREHELYNLKSLTISIVLSTISPVISKCTTILMRLALIAYHNTFFSFIFLTRRGAAFESFSSKMMMLVSTGKIIFTK